MQRINLQKYTVVSILAVSLAALTPRANSQSPSPELQQKVAALKQALGQNKQALSHYTWVETRQMILKGDVKSTQLFQCQYGPDGKVQKSAIGPPQPPPAHQRGMKGRVVEKKTGEMKDYMEQVASLIKFYVPPTRAQIQNSFQAGKASIQPQGGLVTLVFRDYAVPGDSMSVTIDGASNKIRSFVVNTYLNDPSQVVTLNAVFQSLPDGTNYVAQTVLDATAKQIQIRTTSANFNKM
ncbi:MAG: hypothetical protein WCE63_06580 [Acidobacteriaceae bacterium]